MTKCAHDGKGHYKRKCANKNINKYNNLKLFLMRFYHITLLLFTLPSDLPQELRPA